MIRGTNFILLTFICISLLGQGPDIDVSYTKNFDKIWDDAGSDAIFNVGIYRPKKSGYYNLGYVSVGPEVNGGYFFGQGRSTNRVAIVARNVGVSDYPALATPIGYTWIGDDHNSGSYTDCSWWKPIPPPGYVALGSVFTPSHGILPEVDAIMCLREDLVKKANGGIMTYADRESGGSHNLQTFEIVPKKIEWGGLNVGATIASDKYFFTSNPPKYPDINSGGQQLYTLKLPPSLRNGLTLEKIQEIISKRGPILYLHPNEIYEPMLVEDFISNVSEVKGTSSNPGHFENYGDPILGDIKTAKSYVYINQQDYFFTDIQFWFFYGHNGKTFINAQIKKLLGTGLLGIDRDYDFVDIGEHVGDWEHITLRINNTIQDVVAVGYSSHGDTFWYEPNEVGRIKVFSALHSHGSYPDVYMDDNSDDPYLSKTYPSFSGYQDSYDLLNVEIASRIEIYTRNICSMGGKSLDAALNYEIVGSNSHHIIPPQWVIDYQNYSWGQVEEHSFTTNIFQFDITLYTKNDSGPTTPDFISNNRLCVNDIQITETILDGHRDVVISKNPLQISNIVESLAEAEYSSSSISLLPGFKAKLGSKLTINTIGCTESSSNQAQLTNQESLSSINTELNDLNDLKITIVDTLSFESTESELIVYPNPASYELSLNYNFNHLKTYLVKIYDSNGYLVLSQFIDTYDPSLNLENIPNGNYSLIMEDDDKIFNLKILISK